MRSPGDIDHPLAEKRSTLNPYLYGAEMIFKRLIWDFDIHSWISRRRMKSIRNTCYGKKALILCNGPSLNKVDFEMLSACGIYVFGLNKINLIFKRTQFRPSCIVSVNPLVIEQNKDFYNSTEIPLFIDSVAKTKRWVCPKNNIVYLHSGGRSNGFAKDCSMSINQGFTVTYVALQLAFHMGFKYIGIVGADHSFSARGPSNKVEQCGNVDESHFDKDYFANMDWQLPDLIESDASYHRAKETFEAYGRNIYNCTEGGQLNVFDRKELDDFLRIEIKR